MKRGWEKLIHGMVAGLVLPAVVSVYPQTAAANDRVGELMNRLQEMEQEISGLKQELQDTRAVDDAQQKQMQDMEAADTAQQKQLEDRVTTVETTPPKRSHKNLVFFRGGYADYVNDARGFESFTDVHDVDGLGQSLNLGVLQDAEGAWYVGGAIEHSLSDDLWGLWPGTEALGEISLEYKNFGGEKAVLVVPAAECSLLTDQGSFGVFEENGPGNCLIKGDQIQTMFTVSAAPKIKFMQGSKLRPWIIPAGLDFHVISPPSDAATYLDVGVQFAAGVEYEIIPGIKAGIDGRYHLIAGISNTENDTAAVLSREIDQTFGPGASAALANFGNTDKDFDFWTIGGYLGFTF